MSDLIDLQQYPLDRPGTQDYAACVDTARRRLARDGLFSLPGFLRADTLPGIVSTITPRMQSEAFRHARRHNIYFKDTMPGLSADHPALAKMETVNNTLCTDQLHDTGLVALYEWPPLRAFLADVMEKPALHTMSDPIAGLNVMGYHAGEALNWHFDRSEFTVTLLLQAPDSGGAFEYARDLRTDDDPRYDAVADLVEGRATPSVMPLSPGTLNVFKGKNTAHRVTPVVGPQSRMVCVLCYYEWPGAEFTDAERLGFYGRTG